MSDVIDIPILTAVKDLWRSSVELAEADAISAAESAAVRWAWFTDDSCCSPEPFCAQRQGDAPGRELRAEPEVISDVARCGFDQHGRAVVSSWYYHAGHSVMHTVRFFEGDTCRQLVFSRGLVSVTLYEYDHGVLVRQAELDQRSSTPRFVLWEYSYGDDGRLDQVHSRSWGGGFDAETQRRSAAGAIEAFEYDDEDNLSRITVSAVLPGPPPRIIYKRRTKASTGGKPQATLPSQLAESIETAVKQCDFVEQVWCLALHYERESPFPPDVVLGTERERREWGSEVDLLNPAEWDADNPPRRLKLVDPALLDACAAAWDALSADDQGPEEAVKVLNATAKRLNRGRLRDHLNVTEDFFVYAVDLELDDLDANLRAALRKERYRKLRDSGLTSA